MAAGNMDMEELGGLSVKEIGKMEAVLKELKVIDNSGLELYNLVLSYFTDAKHFLDKKDFVRAFEAVVISWAYCDAGLHLKAFHVAENLKKLFTTG